MHLALQLSDERLEPAVPNTLDDDPVELEVVVQRLARGARALADGLDLDEPLQLHQHRVVDRLGGDPRGHALERRANLVDLEEVVDPQLEQTVGRRLDDLRRSDLARFFRARARRLGA